MPAERRPARGSPQEVLWGGHFLTRLLDAGLIPPYTQRVVIDASVDDFVRLYIEAAAEDGEELTAATLQLLEADILPTTVLVARNNDPSTSD